MTELKMVYELVISRANPLDNPRYELLNQAQRKMLYQKIPSGRFWIMSNDFFEKYKLNSRDFMVYCFLVSKKDKKGKSYWSIRRMAEQCNMSYESVRRAIKSLEDQCLIDVEHCSVNGKKIQIFILCIG